MSAAAKEEGKRRRPLVLRPSSRAPNISVSGPHGGRRSSSVLGQSRRSFSKLLDKSVLQTPRQAVRVFDDDNNDVTPQPLYQVDPGAVLPKFFVEETSAGSASEQTTATGSFTMPFSRSVFGSSRISSQSTIESVSEELEDTLPKRELAITFPDVKVKKETAKQQVTEDMLKELVDVFISETDSSSLLDMPSTFVSVDAEWADAIVARNSQYEEVCRNRGGHAVERSVQTLNAAAKNKQVQSSSLIMVDAATNITSWDMFEPLCDPEQKEAAGMCEPVSTDHPEAVLDSSRGAERSVSLGSTATTVSASGSLKDVEVGGSSFSAELEWELVVLSERLQQCLSAVERSVLRNNFQPQLAAYRQLPVLEDPECPVRPDIVEQSEKEAESCRAPALQCLWVFSCELSRGQRVTCMAWNRKNPDLLAVGYGGFDSRNQRPGLVCCWSIKNLKWPERAVHCDSAVTSLDFSASSPSQLAVGTLDGSITIYDVHGQDSRSISSRESPNRHLGPVWQLRWMQQDLSSAGEAKEEALLSVGADGRISKWFFFKSALDCTDLMKLKRIQSTKKKAGGKKTMTGSALTALTPALCFDFHPTDSSIYLTGTWEGLIHRCSCSNSQQVLETYRKHFCAVNRVAWSPFHPDVFLSCSSDGTIQLWKQHHLKPVLGFTSIQKAVCDVKWSPKWATVFGAVSEEQLEIWDLNLSILDPVLVQPAAPGLRMTSLLFASHTDCVVVGDSDGQVAVYQLRNLSVAERSQGNVDVLEDLLCSAAS